MSGHLNGTTNAGTTNIDMATVDMGTGDDAVEPLLQLDRVRSGYGAIEVLHGVDLSLEAGTVLALLGPNGAGKSSALRVCSGLLPISSGALRIAGRDVSGARPSDLARLGVCSIPEGRGVFPNLTVRENLWLATGTGTDLATLEAAVYERFPILGRRKGQLAGTMSGGEQQMLALSRAMGTNPVILLLDELSMGLAPMIVTEMYDTMAGLVEEGLTLLIAEQFAQAVLPIANVAALILQGRIVMVGQPEDIARDLATSYLGGTENA
jgi:branched-chain amino acid transport system ATP-binding protein